MFTGLVEARARVERIGQVASNAHQLELVTPLDPGPIGASLAVDGVCLTITEIQPGRLAMVIGPETLARTTLGALRAGDEVNLERPLRLGDRLGGHLVTGHVDATGAIARRRELGEASEIWIAAPPEVMRYVIVKGSIAIDGISLTVNRATETELEVTLIPHTQKETTLDRKPAGARVNLEADLLGKYVERLLAARTAGLAAPAEITRELLERHGFAEPTGGT
jgi:riboflavin synthase